jgi:hypothetical protein
MLYSVVHERKGSKAGFKSVYLRTKKRTKACSVHCNESNFLTILPTLPEKIVDSKFQPNETSGGDCCIIGSRKKKEKDNTSITKK